jgi:hypothetical protein
LSISHDAPAVQLHEQVAVGEHESSHVPVADDVGSPLV